MGPHRAGPPRDISENTNYILESLAQAPLHGALEGGAQCWFAWELLRSQYHSNTQEALGVKATHGPCTLPAQVRE